MCRYFHRKSFSTPDATCLCRRTCLCPRGSCGSRCASSHRSEARHISPVSSGGRRSERMGKRHRLAGSRLCTGSSSGSPPQCRQAFPSLASRSGGTCRGSNPPPDLRPSSWRNWHRPRIGSLRRRHSRHGRAAWCPSAFSSGPRRPS